jgi:hypothetical protein
VIAYNKSIFLSNLGPGFAVFPSHYPVSLESQQSMLHTAVKTHRKTRGPSGVIPAAAYAWDWCSEYE